MQRKATTWWIVPALIVALLFSAEAKASTDSTFMAWVQSVESAELQDTVKIQEIQILSSAMSMWHVEEPEWVNEIKQDGDYVQQLSSETSLHIKNYGPGALATPAVRGTYNSQTTVYWNDIRLLSPVNGSYDLSLMPQGFYSNAKMELGGQQYGIGGGLLLDGGQYRYNGFRLRLQSELGSFGYFREYADLLYGDKNLHGRTVYSFVTADNDFPYFNAFEQDEVRQSNAELSQHNFLQQIFLSNNKGHDWQAGLWYQFSDRELPATMSKLNSKENQRDKNIRTYLKWDYDITKLRMKALLAYNNEQLIYRDDETGLVAPSQLHSVQGMFGYTRVWNKSLTKWTLEGSYRSYWDQAETDGYLQPQSQSQQELWVHGQYQPGGLTIGLGIKEALVDDQFSPFLPSADMKMKSFFNGSNIHWEAQAKTARNYRNPTLNERYWVPGGNSDLMPEIGWHSELGGRLYHKFTTFKDGSYINYTNWEIGITGFHLNVDDWIQWSPNANGIWSAQNLKQVTSYGFELNGQYTYDLSNSPWKFQIGSSYGYTRTHEVGEEAQLIYVPKHKLFNQLLIQRKPLWFKLSHTYLGEVFTTRGNSLSLDAYHLIDLGIGTKFNLGQHNGQFSFELLNLANADYQSVANRPMPGRNYKVSLNLNLFKPKQNEHSNSSIQPIYN